MKDDIFDRLHNILSPSIRQLQEMQENLGKRIQEGIIRDLIEADTLQAVDDIVTENDWYFQRWPLLVKFAARAKNRIEGIEAAKNKHWYRYELN